jgi:hypothetical protein
VNQLEFPQVHLCFASNTAHLLTIPNPLLQAMLISGRLPDDITIALRDPNIIAPMLPIVEQKLEAVSLKL